MLALVPAMIAMTLVITFTITMSRPVIQNDLPKAVSMNMLLQHERSLREAQMEGADLTSLTGISNTVFANMGDWQTRVFDGSGRSVVATWAGENSKAGDDTLRLAMGRISQSDFRGMPESASGPYLYTNDGGSVGRILLEDIIIPVSHNTPMIVTIIPDNEEAE